MLADQNFESFQLRRKRLTQCWFALLAFNIFLHLDFVEDFFHSGSVPTRVAGSELRCSAPAWQAQTEESLSWGISFKTFSLTHFTEQPESITFFNPHSRLLKDQQPQHDQPTDHLLVKPLYLLGRCSGLAPPLT
jgi:hypothetical protein